MMYWSNSFLLSMTLSLKCPFFKDRGISWKRIGSLVSSFGDSISLSLSSVVVPLLDEDEDTGGLPKTTRGRFPSLLRDKKGRTRRFSTDCVAMSCGDICKSLERTDRKALRLRLSSCGSKIHPWMGMDQCVALTWWAAVGKKRICSSSVICDPPFAYLIQRWFSFLAGLESFWFILWTGFESFWPIFLIFLVFGSWFMLIETSSAQETTGDHSIAINQF